MFTFNKICKPICLLFVRVVGFEPTKLYGLNVGTLPDSLLCHTRILYSQRDSNPRKTGLKPVVYSRVHHRNIKKPATTNVTAGFSVLLNYIAISCRIRAATRNNNYITKMFSYCKDNKNYRLLLNLIPFFCAYFSNVILPLT